MLHAEEGVDDAPATTSQSTSEKRSPLASERNSRSTFAACASGKFEIYHVLLLLLFSMFGSQ